MIVLEKPVRFVLKRLSENGFSAYIVGGAVRDILLQKIPHDIDVLTHASLNEIETIFHDQEIKIVGKTFPVCIVNGVEVSSTRVTFDDSSFPESDLAKRDLTINAMAYDPSLKTIFDPFNGRKDLIEGIIRFTKNPEKRIEEDPVRMIRACRFAAMINGSFSPFTLKLIESNTYKLKGVARERIQHEILKAVTLERPSIFFRALQQTGLLKDIFPSLDRCVDLDGGPHHKETVFEHCLLVGDAISAKVPVLRLAGYLHDTGKFDAARQINNQMTFIGHEIHFHEAIKDLSGLKFSSQQINCVESLIKIHMRPLTDRTSPRSARRLLLKLTELNVDFKDFMRLRIADRKGNLTKKPYRISQIKTRLTIINKEISNGSAFRVDQLKINGNEIIDLMGIPPGPEVGKIKKQLLDSVLDDPKLNQPDILRNLCRSLQTKK